MADGPLKDNRDVSGVEQKRLVADSIKWMEHLPELQTGKALAPAAGATDMLVQAETAKPPSLPLFGDQPLRAALAGDPASSKDTPRAAAGDGPGLKSPFGPPLNPRPDKVLREIPGSTPQREDHHGGWPVKRFEDRPTGPGPGPPGPKPPVPIGPTDVPDPIVKRPGSQLETRDSVFFNVDGRGLLLTGALTGAAVTTGTWGLDRYTGSIPPGERTGWVKYWRDNLSPSQLAAEELTVGLNVSKDVLRHRVSLLRIREDVLGARGSARGSLADAFQSEIPRGRITDIEQRFFDGRVNLVRDNAQFNRGTILANAGTEAEVLARTKLFTHGEAATLAGHADGYWNAVTNRDSAVKCVRAAEESRDRAAAAVARVERGSITTGGSALMRGLGQGIGIAALTIGADMALDKTLGNNPELKPYTSWGLQGVGLPLILMSRLSTPGKIIGSLAMVGVSHLVDRSVGPPTGMFSTFARPNVPEIALVTASLLAPVRDWRIKTALVAGSWMAGRAYNLLNDKYEFEGKTQAKMQNDARAFIEVDKQERRESTFAESVARTKRFALENENAATLLVSDWQTYSGSGGSLLEVQRGRAALMIGLGEARLEKGTRIDQREYDRGDRALAGKNYDLGGEAANFLRSAYTSLDESQKFARANKGRTVNNRLIDDAEIAQYDRFKEKVQSQLDTIYGAHDLDQVMTELKARAQSQPEDLKRFGDNLKEYASKLTDADPQYKSKILRDLALLHIAFNSAEPDPGTKNEHLRIAITYYESARLLSDKAPDLEKIKRLLAL